MKNTTIRTLAAIGLCALMPFTRANAQAFTENFDDINTIAGGGWVMSNASVAVGSTNWFQGNATSAGGPFDAYNGAANAYIGANYNNTGSTGTISNWLMTPNRTFRNGDVITFYTRKASPDTYADRLEVRLSTNGASTNVGSGSATGDYTTLLLSINPALALGVYPTTWTQYTITISGLPAPTSGRVAFRYFVTGAGFSGTNSDYIGIDNVNYVPYVCPTFTMTPGGALTGAAAGVAYSTSLTQTGALGTPSYAVTAGALPPGLTLSSSGTISGTPVATGTFNFTVTVSDASGCSGSQSYSITSVCGPNPTTLSGLPTLCSNSSPVTLTQGSPAGGTYSGTGVTGASFDPAAGTQSITYFYTDPYGCAYSTSSTVTVNTAPSVSQDPISPVCDNGGATALSGGAPAGGTYSGTGVTGASFDPASGTQTITYTYTDANGCSNSANTTITVNTAPTVTHDQPGAVCADAGMVPLSGASPAGGTYSGTGVTGSDFNASAGTQTLNYSYTDANGCTNDVDFTITVNPLPAVTQDQIGAVCADNGPVALSGGSPAGGAYVGTGVSGTSFDPAAGTQTIAYVYMDANGCSNGAMVTITVNALPNVALSLPVSEMCTYDAAVTLSGGTPAGGTYAGTGVTAGMFDPAVAGMGIHAILYSYTDANGCEASSSDGIIVDPCLGVEESVHELLDVYPNPSDGKFTIALSGNAELLNGVITDLQGKEVLRISDAANGNVIIDLTTVQGGMYFLNGEVNGRAIAVRLVKN